MNAAGPLKIAVIGLGGYAGDIIDLILDSDGPTTPAVVLEAVCAPGLKDASNRIAELSRRGVTVCGTYEEVLALTGVEAVWLPVPIDLHVPFAMQALDAGKAVMVEKPVAGTVDELDALIAARDAAGLPVAVGFQDIYDGLMVPTKRRLLSGELGRVVKATVHGCWPRNEAYFRRADWAGKIKVRGRWVLDSPVNNAMAHFVNTALFLMGPDEESSAVPRQIEAELYRVNAIENYDLASLRIGLHDTIEMLVLLTHGCRESVGPVVRIDTERGHVTWTPDGVVVEAAGETTRTPRGDGMRTRMLERFAGAVRGRPVPGTALASLEVARCHAMVVSGASEASPVRPVPADHKVRIESEDGVLHAVPDIERVFAHCAQTGEMLHASGRLGFTSEPGSLDLAGYRRFGGLPAPAGR